MSLKSIGKVKRTIPVGEDSFDVGGISLGALADLLENHAEELKALFDGKMQVDKILNQFPEFCVQLIAKCALEDDVEKEVAGLPLGAQLLAIKGIWDCSMLEEEEVKKLLEELKTRFGTSLDLESPLKDGSKD